MYRIILCYRVSSQYFLFSVLTHKIHQILIRERLGFSIVYIFSIIKIFGTILSMNLKITNDKSIIEELNIDLINCFTIFAVENNSGKTQIIDEIEKNK